MTMIGSSGPSAPSLGGGGSGGALPTNPTQPTNPPKTPQPLPAGTPPSAPASPTLGHVVVSEVYYAVDAQHGNDPLNQWFELYNGTRDTVDLSGWVMANQDGTSTIPNGYSLPPNSFAIVTQSSDTKNRWTIPNTSLFIILGRPIGAGLHGEGDKLTIRTKTLEPVDNVSWGGNSSVFPVPPKTVPLGHSMGRKSLTVDTNTIADWIDIEVPTPGKLVGCPDKKTKRQAFCFK